MIHRRIARLQFTHAEAIAYVPPAGINIIWLEFIPEKDQVIAEFVCSDLEPDPILRKNGKDIRHELGTTFRHRLLADNLGSHPRSPKRAMMVEHNLDSPLIKNAPEEIKRAADEQEDIHDIEVSKEDAENMKNESTGKRIKMIEPREVRQHKYLSQEGPERTPVERYGPERYVYKMVRLDIG